MAAHILDRYGPLVCDFYALTMAQTLFRAGLHKVEGCQQMYIRKSPYNGEYLLTAGQEQFFDWLDHWQFSDRHIAFLGSQKLADGTPAFGQDFLNFLKASRMELTFDAMPEGQLAFAHEPIMRVKGPLWQTMMVEASILNHINPSSLIATMASRFVEAAGGRPVADMGLRRMQDLGGLLVSRAAYIGGAAWTSNVAAAFEYGIPSQGTMAHVFVMCFENELDAFLLYAEQNPAAGVFLVDTYDTEEGVRNAIRACKQRGIALKGIRLDSGDLAHLSRVARRLMDEAGFTDAKVVATNSLTPEKIVDYLDVKKAEINAFGAGTHMCTGGDQPALGGVYKLAWIKGMDAALARYMKQTITGDRASDNFTREVIKLSEDAEKTSIPGELDVLRWMQAGPDGQEMFLSDTIVAASDGYTGAGLTDELWSHLYADQIQRKLFTPADRFIMPVRAAVREGMTHYAERPDVHAIRAAAAANMARLPPENRYLSDPYPYKVGIERSLKERRDSMIDRHQMAAARRRAAQRGQPQPVPG